MIRTIKVELFPLLGHKTADAAIEFARECNQAHHSKAEDAVVGQRVRCVQYSDQVVAVFMENGAGIRVGCDGRNLSWSVFTGEGQPSIANSGDEFIRLDFSSQEAAWDRAALAEAMTARTFQAIFVTPDHLFLYFSEIGIIAMSVLLDADTREPFVYWDYSE